MVKGRNGVGELLKGKIAVITGGCSGIGLASVERFIEEGAKVAVGDLQDEKGKALEQRFGDNLIYRHTDVTEVDAIQALIDGTAAHFGGLDIVFNNAGTGGAIGTIDQVSLDAWDWTFDLLVRSVAAGIQFAVPHMEKRGGGSIINTSSVSALQAGWAPTAYSTAKAAVLHLSKIAAMDLAQRKIRVNAICPGFISTSIFGASMGLDRAQADQMVARIETEILPFAQALPVAGKPASIANTALWLASDESFFVTGQNITVDGGITSGWPHSWQPDGVGFASAMLGESEEDAKVRFERLKAEQDEMAKNRKR